MYKYDKLIEKESVLCDFCALTRNGLTMQNPDFIVLWTNYAELDGTTTAAIKYLYNPNLDRVNYLTPSPTNANLLLPTKERAIVEYILCERWRDEGTLIEALKTYLWQFKDMDKLYEVADHFKLSREELNYWINEAYNDEEI